MLLGSDEITMTTARDNGTRILAAILWVLFVVIVSARIGMLTGIRANLCLSALVALGFFLDVYGMLLVSACAVLLVNWSPAPTPEMGFYFILPIVIVTIHRTFPLKRWLNAACAAFLVTVIMDIFVSYNVVTAYPLLVIGDALAGALVAGIIFRCMEWAYQGVRA